jgi:hypothetical protein
MSETSIADRWRYWRQIQNLCGFSTPTAMGQSFIITLYFVFIAFAYFKINSKVDTSLFNSRSNIPKFLDNNIINENLLPMGYGC